MKKFQPSGMSRYTLAIIASLACATFLCNGALASSTADQNDAVTAGFSTQPAQGLTDASWSELLLKQQAEWLAAQSLESGKKNYLSKGGNEAKWNPKFKLDSHFVQVGNHKIGIIDLGYQALDAEGFRVAGRAIRILRIKDNQLMSVSCTATRAMDIPLDIGICAAEIYKQLGIRLPK